MLPPDRQREHQANERTFLAWLRTAIALISFGFAISRFSLFLRHLRPSPLPSHPILNGENLGLLLVSFGIAIIALATWRYNQVLEQIETASYRPSRVLIWIVAAMVSLFGLLSLPLVLRRDPPSSLPPTDLE
ncbi:MAG: DUF202 domain-containing protein [Thermostichales cyanobacterium BF4_bins_65]